MDYSKKLVALFLAPMLSIGGAAGIAHGAGYAVFTQGAAALGQGNAATAHTDSPSTIFYNPALMNKLEGTQFEAGTTFIYASHEFHSSPPEGSGIPGTSSINHTTNFPSTFYATHKFNDSVSAGIGVFNPFGLSTEWDPDWEGRFVATKSKLVTYNFNPAVSYRIIPSLSVAAGLDVIHANATLQRSGFAVLPGGGVTEANARFKGDGTGVGFNVAAAYDITKALTLGVSYRSEVEIDIDGELSLAGTKVSNGSTSVRLPAQLTAGLSYQVTDPLVIEAGIRWEQWSAFKQLSIDLETPPVGVSSPQSTPRKWHDTLGMNIGGKYRLNDTVALMAGYIYGSNAVPSYTFDPSIPDSDTHIFCVGSDLNFQPWKVALSYAYQYYTDRTKNNDVAKGPNGLPLPAPYQANGKYQSDAHLLALSIGYKF